MITHFTEYIRILLQSKVPFDTCVCVCNRSDQVVGSQHLYRRSAKNHSHIVAFQLRSYLKFCSQTAIVYTHNAVKIIVKESVPGNVPNMNQGLVEIDSGTDSFEWNPTPDPT